MKRRLWNSFCLFSLLVFAGTLTIWARSYFVEEYFESQFEQTAEEQVNQPPMLVGYAVGWRWGTLSLDRRTRPRKASDAPAQRLSHDAWNAAPVERIPPSANDYTNLAIGNFQLLSTAGDTGYGIATWQLLRIPLWLFLPAAIPPTFWWRTRRKARLPGFPISVTSSAAGDSNRDDAKNTPPMNTD